jgi:hypothetical protein
MVHSEFSHLVSIELSDNMYKNLSELIELEESDVKETVTGLLETALNSKIRTYFGEGIINLPFQDVLDDMDIDYTIENGMIKNDEFTVDIIKNSFSKMQKTDGDLIDFVSWYWCVTKFQAARYLNSIIQERMMEETKPSDTK